MRLTSRAIGRPTAAVLIPAFCMVAGVLLAGWCRASRVSVDALPPVGTVVADTIREHVPTGGTVMVVSESCEICRMRANAIVKRLSRSRSHVLVVATGGGTAFRKLVSERPGVSSQTVFVSASELEALTGARAVPTYATVDSAGRVLASGVLTAGWFGSLVSPARWLRGWRQLLTVQ